MPGLNQNVGKFFHNQWATFKKWKAEITSGICIAILLGLAYFAGAIVSQ